MPLPPPPFGTVDALACELAGVVLEPVAATNLALHERDHELSPPTALSADAENPPHPRRLAGSHLPALS